MVTIERKSKYKYKVMFSPSQVDDEHSDRKEWCTEMFGPGGRSAKLRWRFGWTDKEDTFYFKYGEDATAFMLRWGS
jgi:hypothetical protein